MIRFLFGAVLFIFGLVFIGGIMNAFTPDQYRASSEPYGLKVTQADYSNWPFTFDAGYLRCKPRKQVHIYVNTENYALNGRAIANAEKEGYQNIDSLMIEGAALPTGMIERGLELCSD